MKVQLLEFDDAGAPDDEPVKGITMGHIRHWHDECVAMEIESHRDYHQLEAEMGSDKIRIKGLEIALQRLLSKAHISDLDEVVRVRALLAAKTDSVSGGKPTWHKIQDQIDAWAQETLPPDHAAAIMSFSDRLARHLTKDQ